MKQYSGRIPQDKIEEVRAAADIVQVVGSSTRLTQKGRDYWGLCPFHGDKDPSFKVDRGRGTWYCFGCSEGGSVFNFVMRTEGLNFPESVRYLADRFGVELPRVKLTPEQARQEEERKRLFEACRMGAEFYAANLKSAAGAPARDYLQNRRGFKPELISEWGLGWAPDQWEGLKRHLGGKGFGEDILVKAGLLINKQQGKGAYDRFRGRVIIPIKDRTGKVISFGGRVMGDGEPKYLNGAESPLFRKKANLFNLDRARPAMRQKDRALVVEGYFDVMGCAAHGFGEAVAPLGTALTAQQIRQLKGQAAEVILLFDGDEAGRKAATRSLSMFLEEQVVAKVLLLPQGEDPDSFLKANGAEALEKLLAEARPLTEMVLDRIVRLGDIKSPEGQSRTAAQAGEVLRQIKDPMVRWSYLGRLARSLNQPAAVVADRLGIARPAGIPVQRAGRVKRHSIDKEKPLIEFALCEPAAARAFMEDGCLSCLENPDYRRIGLAIQEILESGAEPGPDAVAESLDDPDLSKLVSELAVCAPHFKPEEVSGHIELCLGQMRILRKKNEQKARARALRTEANTGIAPV
jgi:DNA primase